MKKRFGRIGALAAAAALAVGLGGAPAMAEDATPVTSIPFNKTLHVGANVNTPTDTFNFTVTPSADTSTTPTGGSDYAGQEIYAGVAGGLAAPTAVTSAAAAADGGASQNLAVDASVFTKPGIYRYEVAETAGTVRGMTYDGQTHVVDLYVEYVNGVLQVSNVIIFDEDTGQKESDKKSAEEGGGDFAGVAFDNYFTSANDPAYPGDDDGQLHDVDVTKNVTGNQGDQTKDFTFRVNYQTENNRVLKYSKDGGTTWTDIASGSTFTLKHGETFELGGLADADTYQFIETQDPAYTGAITGDDIAVGPMAKGANVSTGTPIAMAGADIAMTFVNDRQGNIPTGIFINHKAYWILGGAALVLAFGLTRRRGLREEL